MGPNIGRCASPAHFAVVTPVNEIDGGVGRLTLRHLIEKRPIADKEGLGYGRQRRGAIQLGHHFPGRKVSAGLGVGASRDHHVRSFDQDGLRSLWRLVRAACWGPTTRCRLTRRATGSRNRSTSAISPK